MRAILLDPNVFTGCRFQHPNRQTFCWKGARPKTVGPLSGALWGAASLSAAALRQHSCRASFLPMAKAMGIQRPDLVSVSSSTPPDASLPPLSLLWPDGSAGTGMEQLSATAADDLNMIELVQAMVGGEGPSNRLRQRERFARQVLSQLGQEPAVIAYRQDVLEDLLAHQPLRERLGELLPSLEALADASSIPERFQAA